VHNYLMYVGMNLGARSRNALDLRFGLSQQPLILIFESDQVDWEVDCGTEDH